MLESNTFRSVMVIGGIIILALTITAFFTYPMDVEDSTIDTYELIMGAESRYPDSLTMYEALLFNVEGRSRGNVKHY